MELSRKTKALLFREFRLSLKGIIITICLSLGFSIFYSMPFIFKLMDPVGFGFDIRIIIGQMVYLIPVMWILPASGGSTTGMEDVLKKDAESGWLIYSYALPITPRERAGVRFVRRMVLVIGAAVMSEICVFILCALGGYPYEPEMICPVFIMIAISLVNMCITEYFTLSARNVEELKKAYNKAGFVTMALMLGIAAAVYIGINGYIKSTEKIDEIISSLPFPPMWTLFISLPVSAAAAYAVYRIMLDRMSSAYPGVTDTKKEKLLSDNMGGKTITSGYVYMQIARNKKLLILSALMPLMMRIFFTAAYICFSLLDSGLDENIIFSVPLKIVAAVLSVVIVSAFTSSTFEGDKKLWSYFVCASPAGIGGYLYSEYLICFSMAGLAMVGGIFAENLFDTLQFIVTGEEALSLSNIYIEGFFAYLLMIAADIPLMIRFGAKKGSYIKTIGGITLAVIGTAVLASESEGMKMLVDAVYKFIRGEEMSDALLLVISAFPLCGILACTASFFVSEKLYMKGVNDYERG